MSRMAGARGVAFLALIFIAVGPLAAADAAWTLNRLMAMLARVEKVEATFREQSFLAALREPLLLTGTLHYRAPDYVEKRIVSPQPESFAVAGEQLTIISPEHGEHALALADYPPLLAFVEALRGALAGDLDRLQRYYQLQLSGRQAGWRLTLTPTPTSADPGLAETIAAIIISGSEDRILTLETRETGGDRSIMAIYPEPPGTE